MDREKLTDLFGTGVIAALGLLVAVVTFGVLDSTAAGDVAGYKVGGAIAGFLVTVTILRNLYMKQRSQSEAVNKLRRDKQILQQQLLRALPRELDFEVEVDETEHIALARPKWWHPQGGVIFNMAAEAKRKRDSGLDQLPTLFMLQYIPIPDSDRKRGAGWTKSRDDFYKTVLESTEKLAGGNAVAADDDASIMIEGPIFEFVHLGAGGDEALKCLKCVSRGFFVRAEQRGPFGKKVTGWNPTTRQVYEAMSADQPMARIEDDSGAADSSDGHSDGAGENGDPAAQTATEVRPPVPDELAATAVAAPDVEEPPQYSAMIGQQMVVYCYHPLLGRVFVFTFIDDPDDFPESSALMDKVLHSTRFLLT